MEEYARGIKENLRRLSPSEMQSKDVYLKKEIETANLSRLFKNIVISMDEMGYKIDSELKTKIKSGALGESGYVRNPLVGTKLTPGKGRNPRLLAGAALTAVSIPLFFLFFPLGALAIGFGGISLLMWLQNRKEFAAKDQKQTGTTSRIWLLLEGRERGAGSAASPQTVGTHAKKVSAFTLHAAGESNDKRAVQAEVKKLAEKLDFFL